MANPQLDELLARASSAVGRMADLADAYGAIRAQASDTRRMVAATVDGSGALVGLHLEPAALRLDAAELGELIASTAMIAAQRAYARRAAVTEEFNREFAELAGTGIDDEGER